MENKRISSPCNYTLKSSYSINFPSLVRMFHQEGLKHEA